MHAGGQGFDPPRLHHEFPGRTLTNSVGVRVLVTVLHPSPRAAATTARSRLRARSRDMRRRGSSPCHLGEAAGLPFCHPERSGRRPRSRRIPRSLNPLPKSNGPSLDQCRVRRSNRCHRELVRATKRLRATLTSPKTVLLHDSCNKTILCDKYVARNWFAPRGNFGRQICRTEPLQFLGSATKRLRPSKQRAFDQSSRSNHSI